MRKSPCYSATYNVWPVGDRLFGVPSKSAPGARAPLAPPKGQPWSNCMIRYTPDKISLDWNRAVTETFICLTHNIHNTQTSMLAARFKPAIPASERTQAARSPGLTNFSSRLVLSALHWIKGIIVRQPPFSEPTYIQFYKYTLRVWKDF
jgi:hypothetical protein